MFKLSENMNNLDVEDANAEINRKLKQVFYGKIVRKDLTKK